MKSSMPERKAVRGLMYPEAKARMRTMLRLLRDCFSSLFTTNANNNATF